MYYLWTIFCGMLVSLMLALNSGLNEYYSGFSATVVIHVAGLVVIGALVLIKRAKLKPAQRLPVLYFAGGAIGVVATLFNQLAIGTINVSLIVALGLLGQSALSLVVDHFGWFNMPKNRFTARQLAGVGCIMLGIGCMVVL